MRHLRKVYFDVGNTLDSPSTTGIQRVTRQFAKQVLSHPKSQQFEYIPIRFDSKRRCWRLLSRHETKLIRSCAPRKFSIAARAVHWFKRQLLVRRQKCLEGFETNSIFLDIENSWHAPLARATLLPALKENTVAVVKLHYDLIPLLIPKSMPPDSVAKFSEHLQSHLRHADLFLCISHTSQKDITTYCKTHAITAPKMGVVRLGTNHHIELTVRPDDTLADKLISQYGRFILVVGTIEPRKNHTLLLNAYNLIRDNTDLSILIVGKVGWLADDLYTMICSHPDFGRRIHHLAACNDSLLAQLYKAAWLNVFLSQYEGYGLPVAEALALDCPTICSDTPALKEIAEGYAHFISTTSPEELARLIIELDSNQEQYRVLAEQAKDYKPTQWTDTLNDVEKFLIKL